MNIHPGSAFCIIVVSDNGAVIILQEKIGGVNNSMVTVGKKLFTHLHGMIVVYCIKELCYLYFCLIMKKNYTSRRNMQ